MSLPNDVVTFLERVVDHPDGYVIFLKGELESIACLFHTTPDTIEKARGWLHPPERRDVLNEAVVTMRRRAALRHRRHAPHEEPAPPLPPMRTADQLIEDLGATALGTDFLLHAPSETIAVLFHAHPFVVDEARERIRRRAGDEHHAGDAPSG